MGHAMGDFYPSIDLPRNQTTSFDGTRLVSNVSDADYPHPWGILFTVLGTVLLDFDADACQSPARAYLLDVCVAGLIMFVTSLFPHWVGLFYCFVLA